MIKFTVRDNRNVCRLMRLMFGNRLIGLTYENIRRGQIGSIRIEYKTGGNIRETNRTVTRLIKNYFDNGYTDVWESYYIKRAKDRSIVLRLILHSDFK